MKIVNVRFLKETLNYYFDLVQSGEEVVVTSHGQRVARILPATTSAELVEPVRPVKDLRK